MSTHPEVVTLDPASNDDALRLAAAIRSVCDIDGRWDAAEILQALAAPTLPDEPPEHSVVRAGSYRLYRDDIDPAGTPYRRVWFVMYGPDYTAEWMTWPEVCALGTPEVLEPDSVKALRKHVETLSGWVKDAEEKRDEARGAVERVEALADDLTASLDPSQSLPPMRTRDFVRKVESEVRAALKPGLAALMAEPPVWAEDEPAEPAPVEVTEEPTDRNARVKDEAGDVWHRVQGNPNCFTCWTTDGILHLHWDDLLKYHGPLALVETGGQS